MVLLTFWSSGMNSWWMMASLLNTTSITFLFEESTWNILLHGWWTWLLEQAWHGLMPVGFPYSDVHLWDCLTQSYSKIWCLFACCYAKFWKYSLIAFNKPNGLWCLSGFLHTDWGCTPKWISLYIHAWSDLKTQHKYCIIW